MSRVFYRSGNFHVTQMIVTMHTLSLPTWVNKVDLGCHLVLGTEPSLTDSLDDVIRIVIYEGLWIHASEFLKCIPNTAVCSEVVSHCFTSFFFLLEHLVEAICAFVYCFAVDGTSDNDDSCSILEAIDPLAHDIRSVLSSASVKVESACIV